MDALRDPARVDPATTGSLPSATQNAMTSPTPWPGPPPLRDPRWPFAFLLTLYCVLGFTVFGFNRTPGQMLLIVVGGSVVDVIFSWFVRRERIFPLSAWISCCSLAILLNYNKTSALLFLPVLLCIGSKHLLTFEGRHVFNPSMFGVATSLLLGGELITAAPAYQWAGSSASLSVFLIAAALGFFLLRVGRFWLVASFLFFYSINTGIRCWVMRHHLPPEMLFVGTFTTPPFFLFSFYMLTDPQTSPKTTGKQILIAAAIASVDLALHAKESVYTFFYAALIVSSVRYFFLHGKALLQLGPSEYFAREFDRRRGRAALAVLCAAALYAGTIWLLQDHTQLRDPGFTFRRVDPNASGLAVQAGTTLEEVDPRLQHVAKWILSVGDSVAAGDYDDDGDVDLFFCHPLMVAADRAVLLQNDGQMRFSRVAVPALAEIVSDPKQHGLISGATFADADGDGDLDLALAVGFGRSRLLQNRLRQDGVPTFVDVSDGAGLADHTVSLAVTFLDVENDGDLDLLVLNALAPLLPDYPEKTPLNIFNLPQATIQNDQRMFHFMHNGWHNADNGGGQTLYKNRGDGSFERVDGRESGLVSTRWSLSVAVTDLNRDGLVDLYVANDFGPDDLLLNEGGRFRAVRGTMFNDVGSDTYKGMNASAADVDGDGYFDVSVSNVHHSLQAEGSMLWMTRPGKDPFVPSLTDEASARGALNEHRFGWGGAFGDIDNDGWPDLVQANGMVDDRLDRRLPDGARKDYWYVNHKLMQSGPAMHTYANMWGDIRGRVIYPNEARRAYLNRGREAPGHFVDVAARLGLADPDNSRGVLLCDLDNDGDLDAVITNQHGSPSLYESRLRQDRPANSHFLQLDVRDPTTKNRRAVGARIEVRVPGDEHVRVDEVRLLGGFEAQACPLVHVGLGSFTGDVDVSVRWPGGGETKQRLASDRRHVIERTVEGTVEATIQHTEVRGAAP